MNSDPLGPRLIAAVQAHQAGQLATAAAGYRQILAQAPDQPDALHYLGMVIWDAEAPREWTLDEYNTYDPQQQATIRRFLEEHDAQRLVVPHRQNRCVIFNSDLFHRTDDIHFGEAYEDRRINVTMLFGRRADA